MGVVNVFVRKHFGFLYHVLRKANRDDVWGMAAEIAFQLMFALFQALILAVAILSILSADPDVFNSIIAFLGTFMPFEIYTIIRRQIVEIAAANTKGVITLGFIGTIWTMSTLMVTLSKSFQQAYQATETRSFWRLRGLAFTAAILATVLIGIVLSLILLGLQFAHYLETSIGQYVNIAVFIRRFRLPVAFVATTFLVAFLYLEMANVRQKVKEVLPGAVFFSLLWFFFTFCFGLYLRNFPQYNTTYGTLGAFLILMIWMYLTSLAVLMGCELNAELHRRRVLAENTSGVIELQS
jgi:membrane protein